MAHQRPLSTLMNPLRFATCVLLLLGAFSAPAHAQSVTFAAAQTTVGSGLTDPYGVAVDGAGDVFIADTDNNRVVEVPAGGGAQITVGSGLSYPFGVAVDGAGNVFIVENYASTVVKVPAGGGAQTTVGSGLYLPFGVAVDGAGDVFIADTGNNRVVELPAGGGPQTTVPASGLYFPYGVAVDGAGDVFIADTFNLRVVEVSAGGGAQTTVASGLNYPTGVAVDGAGDVFIADSTTVVEVPAGGGAQTTVGSGLIAPTGVAVDGIGDVFIADNNNSQVVEVQRVAVNFGNINVCPAPQTTPAPCNQTLALNYNVAATTTFGTTNVFTQGAPNLDFTPGSGSTCTGTVSAASTCTVNVTLTPLAPGARVGAVQLFDNSSNLLATTMVRGIGQGPAIAFGPGVQTTVPASGLTDPSGVGVDAAGDVFIADTGNNRVVEVPVGGGPQTTVGSGLNTPYGVAVDGVGDVLIADSGNNRVVEVTPGGTQTTVGSGLNTPYGVAVDGVGDVFIADSKNNRVVKVPAAGGPQTTVGSGLNTPYGVAVDGVGDVLIADSGNNRVVEVPAAGGPQTTVGTGLNQPTGVTVDGAGDVFIAGGTMVVEVPAGGGGPSTTVGTGLIAPAGVAVDGAGDVFIADSGNNGVGVVEVNRSQPPALSFAPTPVGSTSSDSPQSVIIQNIGNQPLNAVTPGLVVSGPNFLAVPGSGTPADCASSFALTPGAVCNLSISFEPQSVGTFTSTATFTDNALNASPTASQSIALQGAGQAATTTGLVSSLNPSTYNQSVALAAAVTTTGGGKPTGKVTFTADTSNVLGIASLSGGKAAVSKFALGAGRHSILASYGGDTYHQSSSSIALTQTVQMASTVLDLTSSMTPSRYNQAVTFTASVGRQFGGNATGTVAFFNNGSPLGTAVIRGNQAKLTLKTLAAGTGHISATYSGDSNFTESSSSVLLQVVNKASTKIAVASSLNPASVGQPITFTAKVTSQYEGTVTATVTFMSGAVSLGEATLVDGQASITTAYSTAGTYSITATYAGDGNNTGSKSPVLKQVVDK